MFVIQVSIYVYTLRPNQERLRKIRNTRSSGRNRTYAPAIPVQRANQLSYRGQLSRWNCKFMYIQVIWCDRVVILKVGFNYVVFYTFLSVPG